MTATLTFKDLQTLTGYNRPSDVERCLKDQNIRYFWGKEGPWTTLHHLNYPGGLDYARSRYEPVNF